MITPRQAVVRAASFQPPSAIGRNGNDGHEDVEGGVREQRLERVEDSVVTASRKDTREQGQVGLHPLAGRGHRLDDRRTDVEVFRGTLQPTAWCGTAAPMASASTRVAPRRMYLVLGDTAAAPGRSRFRTAAGGRGDPVQHDREQDDREPGVYGRADVERLQRPDHHLTKPGCGDQRRDGDHGQRGHGALVDSHDDGAAWAMGSCRVSSRCSPVVPSESEASRVFSGM